MPTARKMALKALGRLWPWYEEINHRNIKCRVCHDGTLQNDVYTATRPNLQNANLHWRRRVRPKLLSYFNTRHQHSVLASKIKFEKVEESVASI
jgi:hypothetical protein